MTVFADELTAWLQESSSTGSTARRVTPRGLRAFDTDDADFFCQLLPGSRDRAGIPDSIRFWQERIEGSRRERIPVGVIYGPSGCGKSSFVKAGLLPRLESPGPRPDFTAISTSRPVQYSQ